MSNQAIEVATISRMPAVKQKISEKVTVGKDVLELLTGAMYVDPLSVYREYIQNAADSIDDAEIKNLYVDNQPRIDIQIDLSSRCIKIRDNGIGVSAKMFIQILTAIGGSQKRGTAHRGFRGVGRLSGLGYCQEMTFRSRSLNENKVSELTWDGRKLKEILNDTNWNGSLQDAVKKVTTFTTLPADDYPTNFFEVELNKVIRFKNDVLLNIDAVHSYIGQVCPVAFHPDFEHGDEISNFLGEYNLNQSYSIYTNGDTPVYRPHDNSFQIKKDLFDKFLKPQLFKFEGINGDIDAIGWLLEHDYYGAIPKTQGIHGIRFRAGNIQVGSSELIAEDAFPESRFNSWSVFEVHILNKKITPNGRRDHFEQNVHFTNLVGKIAPLGKLIAKKCRDLSVKRNQIIEFNRHDEKVKELLDIVSHRSTPKTTAMQAKEAISIAKERMNFLSNSSVLSNETKNDFIKRIRKVEKADSQKSNVINKSSQDPLVCLKPKQLQTTNEIFELIYKHSLQKDHARMLIDKITKTLVSRYRD